MTLTVGQQTRFRHEALLYSGDHDFVRKTSAFIRDSVEADEPIFVVIAAYKIDLLKQELGEDLPLVRFADMADVGMNPARIIPAWREFVDDQSSRSIGSFRGIGEPIWAERSPDQLVECQRHEELLNVAFNGQPAWWLVCPYDTTALDQTVIDEAYRTHPGVINDDGTEESATYRDLWTTSRPFCAPLPEPEVTADRFTIGIDGLDDARRRVAKHADAFRLPAARVHDLMLAVSEVATNSLRYGGGNAVARVWTTGDDLCVEIRDAGYIESPLVGRIRPIPGQARGYGLWLANQVCDLVQIRTFESGSVVRLHMTR
jgi:anti-sigma regulatory factor (Ser/Thr protein kinase)